MAQRKPTARTASAVGAVEAAKDAVLELAEEMRNWFDGMPENLQGGNKGQRVEEAADALEGADMESTFDSLETVIDAVSAEAEGDEPAGPIPAIRDVQAQWMETPGTKLSRAVRLANALAALSAGAQALRDRLEEVVEERKTREEQGEELEYDSKLDDLEGELDTLDAAVSDLEGVEFPGMYG